MNITETCLKHLSERKWLELNRLLSDEKNCCELACDPIFSIFEQNLVAEIKRVESESSENLATVLVRIFHLNQDLKILNLSNVCILQITSYLFDKYPSEKYASLLPDYKDAKDFLDRLKNDRQETIDRNILSANLNVKVGSVGKLEFSKSIFNSPQEQELYLSAKSYFTDEIILPNIALSSIIDSKIFQLLDKESIKFFLQSTLDLCIVDHINLVPIFFIELDSSWHDSVNQNNKDNMKNMIFEKAGLKLHRLRKLENKPMQEVFELFIKNYYS